ncbi:MAG: right-handed parallel beta-helix repeat-containing protein [Lachnospiraceae bacterium]|nr:right-handed parallel beta-helix repeat-containing protein [Lachnospiraceae bacterium]
MVYYVNAEAKRTGNGSKDYPFKTISEAARIAAPGDEVLVYPGVYREYVDPVNAGLEDAPITYRSVEPLQAIITGGEVIKGWKQVDGDVWVARIDNSLFGSYNPYTVFVYGDWYFAKADKHTGCVYLNDKALYEVSSLDECVAANVYECSWEPEASRYKWYTEQDPDKDQTVIYANFRGADPNKETIEINVRKNCFFPSKTGVDYIHVDGFNINKAATNWAPPAAFQDGMIGPHWSKGWIIENCEIWGSKCAGISLGKYLDPDNDHYFTYRYVKSPTQMERDAVCKGQYHGWLKEKIGHHIIRHNDIHNCEQGGIIGRMGGAFSIIEDNHIHHINNMMELGGAEISGIKMHAAIDVIMRRNHIHHCTMGIWCDWEAQGTRLTQNLLHDNEMPPFAKQLQGGMMCQDIFIEVSHGPTLIDHNIMLSEVSLRCATQGVALVHNLICGSFTSVSSGTTWRYTPYHIPHRTEVMGFMTILHGDDRFYNNIFVQKGSGDSKVVMHDSDTGTDSENRMVGTFVFDDYPTYDEWFSQFDFSKPANMKALEPAHFGHLPVWSEGNVYLGGAKPYKKEKHAVVNEAPVEIELKESNGRYTLKTNIYELFAVNEGSSPFKMIDTGILGTAFEPEQLFEDTDGTPIRFDRDYFDDHRGETVIPGPFAKAELRGLSRTSILL